MPTIATSTSLLQALAEPGNEEAWTRFLERYHPVIVGFAGHLGLGPQDAEDAAQNTLLAFTRAWRAGRYDREKGGLRAWLFGIARNQVRSALRRNAKDRCLGGQADPGELLEEVPDGADPEARWNREWHNAVLRQCLLEVRHEVEPRTYEAFRLFALEEIPASEVATRLGMTANAVFGAKRRVVARIREIMPLMEDIF